MKIFITTIISLTFFLNTAFAQQNKYYLPVNFKQAYDAKTRSLDGKPGPNYWQNRADYFINVELNPTEKQISGSETITYTNNSPDTIDQLIIHLFPNLYKKGNARDFDIDPNDASDGVEIKKIEFNNKSLGSGKDSKYIEYDGNNLMLDLPDPILSGETAEIGFTWRYKLNEKSHYREGVVDESSFFIAYFFPRIAVYDDIDGWDDWSYRGTAEFYNDFGNFEVLVNVPKNYMVWATGEWQNPEELLQNEILEKYLAAHSSDEINHIITKENHKKGNILKQKTKTTWKYKAENVSDFSFGTSDHYLWDATSLLVDTAANRRVFIDADYNPESKDFREVASIARKSIQFMSFNFPAIPFPYPKMTVFNGLSEMEYPMMVNDLSLDDPSETIKLTSHEIFHTYFPFYTGLNETKYAWMDEGLTSYGESLIASDLDPVNYAGFYYLDLFEKNIGTDSDVPLFVNTEYLKEPVYNNNSYPKAATFFKILHEYLGNEKFLDCLHAFTERWNGKHPTPYDFIFTFEDISQEDLSWFIKPWLFEFGYVDFSIANILTSEEGQIIKVEKLGLYPAPISVKVSLESGKEMRFDYDAGIWKNGNTSFEIHTGTRQPILMAELMNVSGLDTDLFNNIFTVPK